MCAKKERSVSIQKSFRKIIKNMEKMDELKEEEMDVKKPF